MTTFPVHGSETLPWRSATGRRPEIATYEASIPPPLAGVVVPASAATLEVCRAAAVAIGVLEQSFAGQVAALEPFLLRTEAIASSRIEEELTTVDQLARAQHGLRAPRSARTVMGAIDGLALLVERAEHGIELDAILAAHRPLMADDPHERWEAGRLRTVQNWIGGSHRSPRGAVHVPPAPERVPALMADLVAFLRRTDLDPVVQGAVAHGQFESIHPFTDGNGRIGRSLVNALWRYRGVTRTMAVPVASAIVADRDRYFRLVNDYRDGDVDPLVAYLAECATRAADEACVSAGRLAALPDEWQERVHARRDSTAFRLLQLLPRHPVVDAADVVRLTGASTARAYDAVERLEEAGVLRRITESRRDVAWAAGDVLDEAEIMADRLRFA